MSNRESMIYGHTVEQLEKPLEFTDMNIISGLMRLAAGPESAKVYSDLRKHINKYAKVANENTALFVTRSKIINFGSLDYKPEVVGFAATRIIRAEDVTGLHIEGLYVHPTAQNAGHGKALAKAAISFASEQSVSYVQLDRPLKNEAAHQLFHGLDFMTTDSEYPRLNLS
jgi:ribosomal protein S18 acetylase RimI-like enzyme